MDVNGASWSQQNKNQHQPLAMSEDHPTGCDWCGEIHPGEFHNWIFSIKDSVITCYTLWWTYKKLLKTAIEIVDFPIKNDGSFHSNLLVHQRVTPIYYIDWSLLTTDINRYSAQVRSFNIQQADNVSWQDVVEMTVVLKFCHSHEVACHEFGKLFLHVWGLNQLQNTLTS